MRIAAGILACFLVAGLLCAPTASQAAAFRGAFAACRDKDVLKKAFQNPKEPGGAKAAAYLEEKIGAGDCLSFAKGQQVSIDERDGPLWRLRRTGDLDCFWTLQKAVDPNPPIVSSGGGGGGGGGGRKGRR